MKHQNRRQEILNTAAHLIEKKGLAHTSTNDIVQSLGIARGTLYHYFKSKDEIINALVDQMSQSLLKQAKIAADNKEKSVLDRLWLTIASLNAQDQIGSELMAHIHRDENILLHYKIERQLQEQLPTILLPIIAQGCREGLFNTSYPYEVLEMMVVYVTQVIDSHKLELTEAERQKKLLILLQHMEILLGTDKDLLVTSFAQLKPTESKDILN